MVQTHPHLIVALENMNHLPAPLHFKDHKHFRTNYARIFQGRGKNEQVKICEDEFDKKGKEGL